MTDRLDATLVRFREAAIDWAAGGRPQPLVDAAALALADGIDSPTLRLLAGTPRASADDEAWELAPAVFEELGLQIPERLSEAAYIAGAVLVAQRFLDGQGSAREVAERLYAMYLSADYPDELADFSRLADMYDMLDTGVISGSIADADRSTLKCVQHLYSPGALNQRPAIAELVRRSFPGGRGVDRLADTRSRPAMLRAFTAAGCAPWCDTPCGDFRLITMPSLAQLHDDTGLGQSARPILRWER